MKGKENVVNETIDWIRHSIPKPKMREWRVHFLMDSSQSPFHQYFGSTSQAKPKQKAH